MAQGTPQLRLESEARPLGLRRLAKCSGRPLLSSPRCMKRGLWLTTCTLVMLGVTVRKVVYSREKQSGGLHGPRVTYLTTGAATANQRNANNAQAASRGSKASSRPGGHQHQAAGPPERVLPRPGAGS